MSTAVSLVVAGFLGAVMGVSTLVVFEPETPAGPPPGSAPSTAPAAGPQLTAQATSQPTSRRSSRAISAADDTALNLALAAGKPVEIEGVILLAAWSKSGKVMNIDFAGADGKAPPPGTGLVVALFPDQRAAFDAAHGGDAAKSLTGKRVRITGKLAPYGGYDDVHKGAKQVILKNTTQLTLIN